MTINTDTIDSLESLEVAEQAAELAAFKKFVSELGPFISPDADLDQVVALLMREGDRQYVRSMNDAAKMASAAYANVHPKTQARNIVPLLIQVFEEQASEVESRYSVGENTVN